MEAESRLGAEGMDAGGLKAKPVWLGDCLH